MRESTLAWISAILATSAVPSAMAFSSSRSMVVERYPLVHGPPIYQGSSVMLSLMEAEFQRCTREAAGRGATVLLSSHILAEVQQLCDTVTIVRSGRTVLAGRLDELRSVTRSRLTATIASGAEVLGRLEGVHDLEVDGDRVVCTIEDAATAEVVGAVAALAPSALTIEPPSLEELFLRQYGAAEDA